jgi:hypothetical protein
VVRLHCIDPVKAEDECLGGVMPDTQLDEPIVRLEQSRAFLLKQM